MFEVFGEEIQRLNDVQLCTLAFRFDEKSPA